jgi:hypothetical protein
MTAKSARTKLMQTSPRAAFDVGESVVVIGAGRDWTGKISSRRLPDGRVSIHPQYDDTAIFVTFDETGISMPVALRQVSKVRQ